MVPLKHPCFISLIALAAASSHIRRERLEVDPGGEVHNAPVERKAKRVSNLSKKGRRKLLELQGAISTASLLERSEGVSDSRGLHDDKNISYKILLVDVVQDAEPALDNLIFNVQRIQDNIFGDTVDVALFHHDDSDTHFKANLSQIPAKVVLTGMGHLCKMQAWIKVTPEIASKYDYVWFIDADLRLEDFSWNLYHRVLSTMQPLVSQPSVLPALPGMRSTDIEELRMMDMQMERFPIAFTVSRTEIQTPIISRKLWSLVHHRLEKNNLHSGWFIDTFWDFVAGHASRKCGTPNMLLVNGSPVRHFNWHDLIEGPNRCIKASPQNDRPVSPDDFMQINAFLKDLCGYTGKVEAEYSKRQRHMTMTEMQNSVIEKMKAPKHNITLLFDLSKDAIIKA